MNLPKNSKFFWENKNLPKNSKFLGKTRICQKIANFWENKNLPKNSKFWGKKHEFAKKYQILRGKQEFAKK